MKKDNENQSKFPSLYSPKKFVTATQYIIELVCQKKATKEKKDLPLQFWKLPEWEKFFVSQLRKCRLLLKKYDEMAIINALRNKRAYNITNLFAPWLIDIIEEEQRLLTTKTSLMDMAKPVDINRESINEKPRPNQQNKNARSKLMELDN